VAGEIVERVLVTYGRMLVGPADAPAELGPLGLLLVIGLYATVAALIWRIRRHPSLFLVAPGVVAFDS